MADDRSISWQGSTAAPVRIRELPASERPRERLTRLGPGALSAVELLALIIGSGGRGRSALDLAQEVFARSGGSLRRIGTSPVASLRAVPGMGASKAISLHAALELGRRLAAETRSIARADCGWTSGTRH